ncbi:MAG: hypothetical protein ACYDAO_02825 [Thermoplasmataceae archaeon]
MGFKDFELILKDAEKRYNAKMKEYQEKWKGKSISQLADDLYVKEMIEKTAYNDPEERYKRLIDIVNQALMLASKLREKL